MLYPNATTEIQKIENEIYQLSVKLTQLRRESPAVEVKDYTFKELTGESKLSELFAGKDKLLLIHNMGQGCRYCTLWADGISAFLPHLETAFSVVLVSKDDPELQRTFANSRGWRFRMASHGGGQYIKEQSTQAGEGNMPGLVFYEKKEGKIFRKTSSVFGPGDQFCSLWHIISLAGLDEETWVPQYTYWKRPQKMDDGGNNLV